MNRTRSTGFALALCVVLASCGQSSSSSSQAAPPAETATASAVHVGDCSETTVTLVGSRLEGVPDSGSSIQYANGVSQVEYSAIPGIDHSRVGDHVRLCLTSVPENCPAGDERGRVYAGTNLRTNETWSAPNAEHSCGGA